MTRPTCATCKAYARLSHECRLHPPVPLSDRDQDGFSVRTAWPVVEREGWCLEHIPALDPDKLPGVMG